jgi:hypothetical protein
MEGIIHYELLERNLTVTAELVNNFAVWMKQSSKTPGSTTRSDSST